MNCWKKCNAGEVVARWDDSMLGRRKFPVFQFDSRIDSVLLDQMRAEFKHFEVPPWSAVANS
jgi:hypothetical protein